MVSAGKPDMPPAELTEAVRRQLAGLIVQTIVPAQMPLLAVTINPELEALLNQSVRVAPDAAWPIEPDLARRIVTAIGEAVEPLLLAARSFAVIVSPLCRPAMARLLRAQFADVAVLSFLEIPEGKSVEIIATVGDRTDEAALPHPDPIEKDH